MADMGGEVTARVRQAVELVAAKSPTDVTAFKGFLLGVAQATADAVKGISDHEATAIARLQDVLF
jgi:hypothetical protein